MLEPPKCPECSKILDHVYETVYWHMEYQEAEGRGEYVEMSSSSEMTCPYCDADLDEVFPNGVCNFIVFSCSVCGRSNLKDDQVNLVTLPNGSRGYICTLCNIKKVRK